MSINPSASRKAVRATERRPIRAACVLAGLLSISAFVQCAGLFNSAGKLLVSESDEAKVGAQFNQSLTSNDTVRKDMPVFVPKNAAQTEMQNYIVGLAKEIVASLPASEKPSYAFTYTLIDKDVENAFAVPGGYVYIYTGILKKLKDESELMGVLGHEITHVTHHHYREQVAENAALSIALQTAAAATNAGQVTQLAAGAVAQLATLKFSRTDESDADKGGTKALGRVGRNPMGIAAYFSRAQSMGVPEWLSDHPGNGNRVKAITAIVNADAGLKALAAQGESNKFAQRYQSHVSAL
jgi:beta-barrel assembly-enhancing protease